MARKIIHQLVDDIDGTVLEAGEGQTVLFSLDGVAYEIDLKDENANALRGAFEPYVSVARRAERPASRGSRGGARRRSGGSASRTPAIRAWANENGYQLADRGRIPANVIEAYDAAH